MSKHYDENNTRTEATATSKTLVVAVSLTVYDWHTLLSILEHAMRFINRDTSQATQLYEAIATQLGDVPVMAH